MITTETLFFELIQVATGQLDCLTRGPEPDEWQKIFEYSKQQHVEGVGYHGVTRLFEFGLRAPQDISLDWMSETEEIREFNEQQKKQPSVVRFYSDDLKMLRQSDNDPLRMVTKITVYDLYRLFQTRQLDMRALTDYYFTLQMTGGKYEALQGGGLFSKVGIRRFASGLMWLLGHTLRLPESAMPFKPLESEGRFLLADIMGHHPWWMYMRHRYAWFQF
ncbi:MAG: hypothetical protein IJS95_08195 [Prevotella sp.]|nr:hypothetical protein [Prevotella sp.]